MSNIDLKQFVNINIIHKESSKVNAIRDTVVLLTTEGTKGDDSGPYSSYAEVTADTKNKDLTNTLVYSKMYFDNNGNKLLIIHGIQVADLATTIQNLDTKYIVVAYTGDLSDLVAVSRGTGINSKLFVGRTKDKTDVTTLSNVAIKYSTVSGAEMTIAAYLSNIEIYGVDTVHDYSFTKETITTEDISDSDLTTILTNNMNVDVTLSNAVRNVGGNTKDGYDLVNEFVLIVLQQTLTDRLVNLLTEKIKGNSGLASINSVMREELGKYLSNGFLTTDKVYTDETLTVNYNNTNYTIIEKNTPLPNGYYITILPLNSLTDADIQKNSTPPIYIVLATSYGIRYINITGYVI